MHCGKNDYIFNNTKAHFADICIHFGAFPLQNMKHCLEIISLSPHILLIYRNLLIQHSAHNRSLHTLYMLYTFSICNRKTSLLRDKVACLACCSSQLYKQPTLWPEQITQIQIYSFFIVMMSRLTLCIQ